MVLSDSDMLYAKYLLEEFEASKTELGVFLVRAIKESKTIPKELKEGFITWVSREEARLAHLRANQKLHTSYITKTGEITQKHWWRFW